MSEKAAPAPVVSVIIPTYNRKDSLLRALESLSFQTYPLEQLEIVVVDDGSSDGTQAACASIAELPLKYVQQSHLGGTATKNRGARESEGKFLIFLDDDITVNKSYVECLVAAHAEHTHVILTGVLHNILPDAQRNPPDLQTEIVDCSCVQVAFTECLGGFFSISRENFMSLGMLQDPAPGFWPNWEDIDLAYRAKQRGWTFWRCAAAIGYHWDHVLVDLKTQCRRWEHAARSAVFLFQKHPGLETEIPMFRDKGPIAWRQDSLKLALRKMARQAASSLPVMKAMEAIALRTEKRGKSSQMQRLLSRWIISGYIYRGYRTGLRQLGRPG